MSVWYDIDVTVIAKNNAVVAEFFNLNDSIDEVRTSRFEFSFSGNHGPSLNLNKIMKQNPDLIFLVRQTIESSTIQWYLHRYDPSNDTMQNICIQKSGEYGNEINKKLLEDYTKEYPTLPAKHLAGEKGYEEFRWSMFFNDFDRVAFLLKNHIEYEKMLQLNVEDDFSDDFSHLELEND